MTTNEQQIAPDVDAHPSVEQPGAATPSAAPGTLPVADYDMPDDEYHADPLKGSISSGEIRLILESPARLKYKIDHPRHQVHKPEFDLGHAAHKLVLGKGSHIIPIDAENWRTKDAKEQRDAAYAAGHIPLLADQYAVAKGMAEVLTLNPLAAKLIDHNHGKPEVSMFWDEGAGVLGRARVDWLPDPTGRRRIIVDYKTAASADPAEFGRSAANYGYHIQDAWYRRAVTAVFGDEDPAFVFVVQEKHPPYLVSVIELDAYAKEIGEREVDRALGIYRQCIETQVWPGYGDTIHQARLARWAEIQYEETAA